MTANLRTLARAALPASLLLLLPACSMPSGSEWLIVLFIALLLFGSAKLPSLMRSMGSGISEFKKGLKEGESDDEEGGDRKKAELDSGDREKAGQGQAR